MQLKCLKPMSRTTQDKLFWKGLINLISEKNIKFRIVTVNFKSLSLIHSSKHLDQLKVINKLGFLNILFFWNNFTFINIVHQAPSCLFTPLSPLGASKEKKSNVISPTNLHWLCLRCQCFHSCRNLNAQRKIRSAEGQRENGNL